jgi:hypothetical protein
MPKNWSRIFGIVLSLALALSPVYDLSAGMIDAAPPNPKTQGLPLKDGQQPTSQQTYSSPDEAARSSLEILKTPGFFREETGGTKRAIDLGFESVAEVADATLGAPLPVINVWLDQLSHFQPNDDPKKLVKDPHTVIFPLYVKSAVRSSLTVSAPTKTNAWLRMGRGSPILIRTIEQLRGRLGQPGDTFFLVMNRGIGLRFLARKSGDTIMLIPLDTFTFGTFELKAGEEWPAKDVILKLVPVTKMLSKIYEQRKVAAGAITH